jgi:hypothetical protein
MLFHPMLPFIGAWSFCFLVSISVTNLSWHSKSFSVNFEQCVQMHVCLEHTYINEKVQRKFYGGFVNVSDIFLRVGPLLSWCDDITKH